MKLSLKAQYMILLILLIVLILVPVLYALLGGFSP